MDDKVEYILTLNSNQAKEVLKTVELLMRLKLGQYQELSSALIDVRNDDFIRRAAAMDSILSSAFVYIDKEKNKEWYRLYNLYQVLRKAIHDIEWPNSFGVDGDKPMQFTEEPLPKIEVRRNE